MAYDAEIRVGTKVDTSQMQKLQIQINKTTDKVARLTQEMRELKNTEIPTDEYKEVQKQIEITEAKLNKLLEKKESFKGSRKSVSWLNLNSDIEELQNSLPYLKGELQDLVDTGKAFTLGTDTDEYAKKAKELSYAQAELQAFNTKQDELSSKQQKSAGSFSKMATAAKKAFTALSSGAKSVFGKVSSVAKKAFGSVNKDAKKTNGLLATMRSRMQGLALSLLVFNQISKAFNAMVSGAKEGISEFAKYSKDCNAVLSDFKSSLQTMKYNLGAAFAPIVQTVLPYLTAFINALNSVISKISQFFAVLTGSSTYYRAIQQQVDFAGSLEDTANAAKEAAGALAGFDKLNVVKQQEDSGSSGSSGSGSGGEFEEVPIDSNIKALAEKVKEILAALFAPLKEAWEREGEFVMESWKSALDEVWLLVKDIGRDFLIMWNEEETVSIFEDLLHILGDIGLVVANLARNFREAWNENQNGLRIFEGIRDIIAVIVKNIRNAADETVKWADGLNFSPLMGKISEWIESLIPAIDSLSGILSDFYTLVLLPLAGWAVEEGLPDLLQVFIDFNKKVDWEGLRTRLAEFWKVLEPFAETVGEGVILFIGNLSQKIADFTQSETFKKMLDWLEEKMKSTTPEDIAKGIERIATAFIVFKTAALGLKALTSLAPAVTTIKSLIDIFKGGAGAAAGAGATGFFASISGAFASLGGLSGVLTTDLATIFGAGTAAEIGTTLGVGVAGAFMAAFGGFELGKWLGKQLFPDDAEWYDNFKWTGEDGFFETFFSSINDGSWKGALELWKEDVEGWFDKTLGEWSTLKWSDVFGQTEKQIEEIEKEACTGLSTITIANANMALTLSDTTNKTKEMTNEVANLSNELLSVGKTSLEEYQQGISNTSGPIHGFMDSLNSAFDSMEAFNSNASAAGLGAGLALSQGLNDSTSSIGATIGALGIKIATEGVGVQKQATVLGGSTIAGFNNGIANNMDSTDKPLNDWESRIVKTIHDGALKFGSPSKTTEEFGADTVTGYNNGIKNNVSKTVAVINSYMQTIQSTFKTLVKTLYEIGQESISSLIKGLASKQSELKKTVEDMTKLMGEAATASSNINIPTGTATTGTKSVSYSQLATSSVVRGGNPYGAALSKQSTSSSNSGISTASIKQAMKEAMKENGGGEYIFVAQLNGKTLYKETVKQDQIMKKSTGKSGLGN